MEFDETLDEVEDLRTRDSSSFCVSESPFVDCLVVPLVFPLNDERNVTYGSSRNSVHVSYVSYVSRVFVKSRLATRDGDSPRAPLSTS